jgi:hypothetical protein
VCVCACRFVWLPGGSRVGVSWGGGGLDATSVFNIVSGLAVEGKTRGL